jgi:hypothetical protein
VFREMWDTTAFDLRTFEPNGRYGFTGLIPLFHARGVGRLCRRLRISSFRISAHPRVCRHPLRIKRREQRDSTSAPLC